MKNYYIFLLLFLSFIGFSQEKNSLLWEISGNGLEHSSYLYGTMHVSKKIAFRLDDVFYDALNNSDIIALESDPNTWLEEDGIAANKNIRNRFPIKGFYKYPFVMKNPKKEMIGAYISFEDRLINNILYRTNPMSQDFEEETYLDMFIYQAGKKYNKPIVALEDLEESSALVGRAGLNAMRKKPAEWLQKKMQEEDPMLLLQNAYRERNINLLDSIDQGMYTEHYLKNMLYVRNENMVRKLDSLMHLGKVFTGIGAAHLPGKQGVITLLRKKGYKVTPLTSRATSRGDKLKAQFTSKLKENTYQYYSVDDHVFSLLLPNKLYPIVEYINSTYISPNLANGSYLMVNRIPMFSFLKKEDVYTIKDIDELLFENIPGKIIEKTSIVNNGYSGIDIKNKLKNGDYQRYHIYITPLEILIFKMGGEGDYVTKHSDTIFNSLKFKPIAPIKEIVTSGYGDFEIEMPSQHTFSNKNRNGSRGIEGYDKETDTYYFLRKVRLNDFNFIEEDAFELKQIQKRFYEDLELDPVYNEIAANTLTSKARFNAGKNQYLYLKTVFKQGDYYLMGALTTEESNVQTFFNSFQLKEPNYTLPFVTVKDTAMYFTTKTTVKPPKFVDNSTQYNQSKKVKPYSKYTKKTVYQNKNDEAITVELNKSHDYLMFPSIDSVWALRKKIYADKKFKISSEKASFSSAGFHELQLTLTDTASSRGILIKNIAKNGAMYEIKAIVDTIQKPSTYVKAFFDNFMPYDTIIGRDILEDKTTDFFTALKKNDSIILEGHRYLLFNEKHIDSLKYYISKFQFKEEQQYIQNSLIQKMGKIKDPRVVPFLSDFYTKSYDNSTAQTKILQTISKKSNVTSTSLLLDLMSKDLPLTDSAFEIKRIFAPYLDSLPLAKKLYPKILDYSSIEEYKGPVFSILAKLKQEGYVKSKIYKKYRKQILNDAKIQLKRHLGVSRPSSQQIYISTKQKQNNKILEDYTILLHPFIKEPEVALFFKRLMYSKNPRVKTTYAAVMVKENNVLPNGMLDSLAGDLDSRLLLFKKLKKIDRLDVFPKKYISEKSLAEALLFKNKSLRVDKESCEFLLEKPIQYKNEDYTGYYFKFKKEDEYDKNYYMYLVIYKKGEELQAEPFYDGKSFRINDTDTDEEIIDLITEQFLLKDRKRAMINRKNQYNSFHSFGY